MACVIYILTPTAFVPRAPSEALTKEPELVAPLHLPLRKEGGAQLSWRVQGLGFGREALACSPHWLRGVQDPVPAPRPESSRDCGSAEPHPPPARHECISNRKKTPNRTQNKTAASQGNVRGKDGQLVLSQTK